MHLIKNLSNVVVYMFYTVSRQFACSLPLFLSVFPTGRVTAFTLKFISNSSNLYQHGKMNTPLNLRGVHLTLKSMVKAKKYYLIAKAKFSVSHRSSQQVVSGHNTSFGICLLNMPYILYRKLHPHVSQMCYTL